MPNERSPLWQVLMNAGDPPCTIQEMLAAEIRAVRDWLFPEETEPEDDGVCDGLDFMEQLTFYEDRQRLRDLLTSEAERAENPKQP